MKNTWSGIVLLLSALPLSAQTLEELQRDLADKEAEVRQLRQRIESLERRTNPVASGQPPTQRVADDQLDAEAGTRALERALVRERSVLLPLGKFELESNFVYSHFNDGSAGFRRDAFGPGLVLRAGLPARTQFELAVPYVWERRRSGGVRNHSDGIGDVSIGISHQLLTERPSTPGVVASLTYSAATGRNTIFTDQNPVTHGSGFNAIQGSFIALKRMDPLVFFGSYSLTHNFSENKNGIRVDPGNSHGFRFGTALAASPQASLRAAFSLTFFDKLKYGGQTIGGSEDPVGTLDVGGSVVLGDSTALDIMIGAGLTRNAPDFRISIGLPYRF